eukprot:12124373-Heterocapsa_arctica.AAC.1
MWDFGAESAPTDPAGLTTYSPAMIAALGHSEEVLGSLVDCAINNDAREQLMGEMMVAMQSEVGLPEWFKTAVETARFFKSDTENIS